MTTAVCPNCGHVIAFPAPQGGLRIAGIATTLVSPSGDVYGPCKGCRTNVTIAKSVELDPLIKSAIPRRRNRTVFVVTDDG